jgi:hypothetical protein
MTQPLVPDVDGDPVQLSHWLTQYADACLMSGAGKKAEAFRVAALWADQVAKAQPIIAGARRVVWARYGQRNDFGQDIFDYDVNEDAERLDSAIKQLEDIVGRPKKEPF